MRWLASALACTGLIRVGCIAPIDATPDLGLIRLIDQGAPDRAVGADESVAEAAVDATTADDLDATPDAALDASPDAAPDAAPDLALDGAPLDQAVIVDAAVDLNDLDAAPAMDARPRPRLVYDARPPEECVLPGGQDAGFELVVPPGPPEERCDDQAEHIPEPRRVALMPAEPCPEPRTLDSIADRATRGFDDIEDGFEAVEIEPGLIELSAPGDIDRRTYTVRLDDQGRVDFVREEWNEHEFERSSIESTYQWVGEVQHLVRYGHLNGSPLCLVAGGFRVLTAEGATEQLELSVDGCEREPHTYRYSRSGELWTGSYVDDFGSSRWTCHLSGYLSRLQTARLSGNSAGPRIDATWFWDDCGRLRGVHQSCHSTCYDESVLFDANGRVSALRDYLYERDAAGRIVKRTRVWRGDVASLLDQVPNEIWSVECVPGACECPACLVRGRPACE